MNLLKINRLLILSVILGASLSSCLKDKVSKNTDEQPDRKLENFSRTVKVQSFSDPSNYVELEISSFDSLYAEKIADFYSKLEIGFETVGDESLSTPHRPVQESSSVFSDSLSYSMHFDWSNFTFNENENGKKEMHQLVFKGKQTSKGWVYYPYVSGLNMASHSIPWAYVRVFNTTRYWNFGIKTSSNWVFYWDQYWSDDFYSKILYVNNDLAATARVSCAYSPDHVRIHPTYPTTSYVCSPSNPTYVLVNDMGAVAPSNRTNGIRGVRGYADPANASLDNKVTASVYFYRWY